MSASSSQRTPIILVCLAYCWWGCSALFWRELRAVPIVDQFSFRVVTGFGYLVIVWMFRKRNPMRSLTRDHLTYGLVATVVIAMNWIIFLWAISSERAVEAALGYFLMPLFAVGLGVVLLWATSVH